MAESKRYRSAVTGRFVSAKEAAKHPAKTVSETVKKVVAKLRKS